METYIHVAYDKIVKDDIAPTLKASGENYGGQRSICYCRTCGALQARDYKWVGSQYVYEGKLIVEENDI